MTALQKQGKWNKNIHKKKQNVSLTKNSSGKEK